MFGINDKITKKEEEAVEKKIISYFQNSYYFSPRGIDDLEFKITRRTMFSTHCGRNLIKAKIYKKVYDNDDKGNPICPTHENMKRVRIGEAHVCVCPDCRKVNFYSNSFYIWK